MSYVKFAGSRRNRSTARARSYGFFAPLARSIRSSSRRVSVPTVPGSMPAYRSTIAAG